MSQLTINNLTHCFDHKEILNKISFTVESGVLLAILGASGSGKTTLLRLIAGFEILQKGTLFFDSHPIANEEQSMSPEKRKVGMVFQDYALFPHLSVHDNLIFGLTRQELRKKGNGRYQWTLDAAARLGLMPLLKNYPYQLSGGEQQRVALLRAIAPEPNLLLLDEPFSGLDPQRRRQTREEALTFIRDTKITTLLVTHDPEEACCLADQLLILENGMIAQMGSPSQVKQNPATKHIAEYFKVSCR